MRHLDLFSGIGGFALAADRVWENIEHIFCDNDKFCQQVLKKHWPNSIIYGDIRTLTNTKGIGTQRRVSKQQKQNTEFDEVDLLTGGFPCQPFSQAGHRKGTADDRYLWPEMFRIIREFSPKWVVAENVRGLVSWSGGMVLEQVCSDMEAIGYEVQPFIIPACAVNAPHRRDRIWIVAHAKSGDDRGKLWGVPSKGEAKQRSKNQHQEEASESSNANHNASDPNSERGGAQKDANYGDRAQGNERWEKQPQHRVDGQGSNVANTEGGKPWEQTEPERRKDFERGGWERNWIEVATELCGVDARFSSWVDRFVNDVIYLEYVKDSNPNKAKEMQILFQAIRSQKIREKIGGLWKVGGEEVLLQTLCQLQKRVGKQKWVCLEGKKIQEAKVRILPEYQGIGCSPQRRRHNTQLARELTDIVQGVSYETALEIVEAGSVLWGAYSSIYSQEVKLDGFILTKAQHRVQRLKSLGNAIVPQVAENILRAIANNACQLTEKR